MVEWSIAAVLKTVETRVSGGSNPSLCAKKREWGFPFPFFCIPNFERDSRVGAVLREQNALPNGGRITKNLTAKADVDNVGAGRAAKGENPLLCAKQISTLSGCLFCLDRKTP